MKGQTMKVDLPSGVSVRHSNIEHISTHYGVLTLWRVGDPYSLPFASYAPGAWSAVSEVAPK